MSNLPSVAIVSDERFPAGFTDTQQIMKNSAALARAGVPLELVMPRRWGRSRLPRQERLDELARYYSVPYPSWVTQIPTIPSSHLRVEKVTHAVAAPLYLRARGTKICYGRNLAPTLLAFGLGMAIVMETYRAWGYERPPGFDKLVRLAQHRRFLGLICHSRYAADSIIEAGVPAEKVAVMHNGFDLGDMEPRLSIADAREKLGIAPTGPTGSSAPLVVYTGNLQENKGIESILEVAARVPEAHFLFVGGEQRHIDRLQGVAAELGAHNVEFAGHKPVGDMPLYLFAADVLVVPPTAKPLAEFGRTVLPMKLFSYLGAGRTILGPNLPDSGELLRDGENARLVEPDEPEGAAAALRALLESSAERDRLGRGALETSRGLTWDARARKIKSWLEERWTSFNG